ncbi:MAG: hypothetical protein JOY99_12940 [Sphingomonadaceae bacterium]|nr:hypothetical protein [Sphingomonadaceae bacterium]
MATQPYSPEAAAVIVAGIFARFEREQLDAFVEIAVDLMDALDPDTDLEETGTEDGFLDHPANGPGCPLSDAGGSDDEAPGDPSWPEVDRYGRPATLDPEGGPRCEDTEEDDPPEDEDSPHDAAWRERVDQATAGLPRMRAAQKHDDGSSQAIGSVEDLEEDDAPEDDLEDRCLAGDDGCGPIVSHGVIAWGSSEDDLGAAAPIYGIDQTAGPINQREAGTAHQAAVLSLVPNGRGWRRP